MKGEEYKRKKDSRREKWYRRDGPGPGREEMIGGEKQK